VCVCVCVCVQLKGKSLMPLIKAEGHYNTNFIFNY